jgi:hypothetical protein
MNKLENNFPEEWSQLCEILDKILINKKWVCINEYDNAYITISDIKKNIGGCGQCKINYETLSLQGQIKTNYLNPEIAYKYGANISQYEMHKCPLDEDDENGFNPFLKFEIINTRFIPHYYVDVDDLRYQLNYV